MQLTVLIIFSTLHIWSNFPPQQTHVATLPCTNTLIKENSFVS